MEEYRGNKIILQADVSYEPIKKSHVTFLVHHDAGDSGGAWRTSYIGGSCRKGERGRVRFLKGGGEVCTHVSGHCLLVYHDAIRAFCAPAYAFHHRNAL